jgi:type I site-specific restriction endonuclease
LRRISEERTRKEMIDPQLEKAGWYLRDHAKVKIEIPVDGYDAEPWNGVTDYCLYRENGEVLAVVEAKKTAVDVRRASCRACRDIESLPVLLALCSSVCSSGRRRQAESARQGEALFQTLLARSFEGA